MVDAIRSALGLVKHLLPVSTGGPLPLTPRLPDVPSFLDGLLSLLGDSSAPTSASPESPESQDRPESDSFSGGDVEAAEGPGASPTPSPRSAEEEIRREIERRVAHLPPEAAAARLEALRRAVLQIEQQLRAPSAPDDASKLLQALQMIRKQAGGPPAPLPVVPAAPPSEPSAPALADGLAALGHATPGSSEAAAPGTGTPAPELPPLELPPAEPFVLPPPAPAEGSVVQVAPLATAPIAPPLPAAPTPPPTDSGLRALNEIRVVESRPEVPRGRIVPGANRGEFIDRMVKAARLTQTRGAARIKIILHPPHLGELKVDLKLSKQILHASLQAENPAAKDLLQSHLPALREALESQGIQVGEFEVNVDEAFAQGPGERDEPAPGTGDGEASGSSDDVDADTAEVVRSIAAQVIDVIA